MNQSPRKTLKIDAETLVRMDPRWAIYGPADGALQFLRAASRHFHLVLFSKDDAALRALGALWCWLPEVDVSLPREPADGAWCLDAELLDAVGGWQGAAQLLLRLRPGALGGEEAGESGMRERRAERGARVPVFTEELRERVLGAVGDKIQINGLRGRAGAKRALQELREVLVPMFDEARVESVEVRQ